MGETFDIMMCAIELLGGLYLIWCGITGKGKIMVVENLKEGMEEEFKAKTKLWCIIMGVLLILAGGSSALLVFAGLAYLRFFPLSFGILFIVAIVIYYLKVIKKCVNPNEPM